MQKKKNKLKIFLNSSQHIFDLGLSETIMLRNYANKNNWKFCSMIGGSESIRDLEESKNLFVDAFEFPLVESSFSLLKIFSALKRVFDNNLKSFSNKTLFINIASIEGLNFLQEIEKVNIPDFINPQNLIFNFDRRMIIRSLNLNENDNFDVHSFEPEINLIVDKYIKLIKSRSYKYCISGGITEKSLNSFNNLSHYPDYIKAGIFTIEFENPFFDDLFKTILQFQCHEAKLINIMKKSLNYKHDYLNIRELHMMKYLIDSIS